MKTKIGVLGCAGSMGQRHVKNFQQLGCEVHGYDPTLYGFQVEQDILREVDAVVIASPTQNHYESIKVCHLLEKPMLVEKPMVAHQSEMEAPLKHIKLVGYNLRFHSCVKKVKAWMGEGLIGKPLWARFTCAQFNNKPAYLRDGVVLNWSHEIDLALHLLGPGYITGTPLVKRFPEDTADFFLTHDHTFCVSLIHLDYLTQPERRGFAIIGENGSIDADLVSRQAFLKDRDGKLIHCHFGRDSWDGNYLHEAMSFLAHVRGKVDPANLIGCTAKEALDVVAICIKAKEKSFYGPD
jgi:predicted dehydrogenase